MLTEIGTIEALFRYPVKSMRGDPLETATLGLHGLEGDRRLALRRVGDHSGFPWLTASKLPDLVRYSPQPHDNEIPSHIRTPEGDDLAVFGPELAQEIANRCGAPVEMLHLRDGVFDDAPVSVIARDTIEEISRLAEVPCDARRFRPNILLNLANPSSFQENDWLNGILFFGEGEDAPAVSVSLHDIRCVVVNVEPETAKLSPEVLKTIVRVNRNRAGVYCSVIRSGKLEVGQKVFFRPSL